MTTKRPQWCLDVSVTLLHGGLGSTHQVTSTPQAHINKVLTHLMDHKERLWLYFMHGYPFKSSVSSCREQAAWSGRGGDAPGGVRVHRQLRQSQAPRHPLRRRLLASGHRRQSQVGTVHTHRNSSSAFGHLGKPRKGIKFTWASLKKSQFRIKVYVCKILTYFYYCDLVFSLHLNFYISN